MAGATLQSGKSQANHIMRISPRGVRLGTEPWRNELLFQSHRVGLE